MMNTNHLSPEVLFGALPVLKVRFRVRFPEQAVLPRFLGSAWRGLIGWQMIKLICPFEKRPKCLECSIHEHCPYFVLMEKRSTLPGLSNTPRGYVVYCAGRKREVLDVDITLFGSCTQFLPVISMALFKGQEHGLGAGRHPYEILSYEQACHSNIGWL